MPKLTKRRIAMIEENKTTKKSSWRLEGYILTATMPDKSTVTFDTKKVNTERTLTPFEYYGFKQWLADGVASAKTTKEKIEGMKEAYDALDAGIEITSEGRLRIIGSTRANAGDVVKIKKDAVLDQINKAVNKNELNILKALFPAYTTQIDERAISLKK